MFTFANALVTFYHVKYGRVSKLKLLRVLTTRSRIFARFYPIKSNSEIDFNDWIKYQTLSSKNQSVIIAMDSRLAFLIANPGRPSHDTEIRGINDGGRAENENSVTCSKGMLKRNTFSIAGRDG